MKKKILIAISLFTILFTICSCGTSADSSTFEGTWQFCGIVEEGSEVSIESAILNDDFLKFSGLDNMSEDNLIIDESGLNKVYENIPGCEVGQRTDIDTTCFTQEVKILISVKSTSI